MPELPEVETVVQSLSPKISGKVILSVSDYPGHERVFEHISLSEFISKCKGQTIRRLGRRGKYILFFLPRGLFAVHLRMTGVLKTALTESDNFNHLAVKIEFSDNTYLYFKDYRKFGRFYFFNALDDFDSFLGVEPLSGNFTKKYLKQMLASHKRQIKPFLLDQKYIAGLGNIYVDEALWRSKIHPAQISSTIPAKNIFLLFHAIQNVLQEALALKGTTFMTFSFDENKKGEFKNYLNVFGRNGTPCSRCGELIVKSKVSQRGTHYCPACQKLS